MTKRSKRGHDDGAGRLTPSAVKDTVAAMVHGEWLEPYPQKTRDAAIRAVNHWGSGSWPLSLDSGSFMQAVYAFESATSRGAWDEMPQRERDEWEKKFNSAVDAVVLLSMQGPRTPQSWGFPVRDKMLMHALRTAGFDLPSEDSTGYFKEMFRLEERFDESNISIVHVLQHYQTQLKVDSKPRQLLKKPRDDHANRALFIITVARYTKLPVSVIAGLTESMFLTNIEERIIRRLIR